MLKGLIAGFVRCVILPFAVTTTAHFKRLFSRRLLSSDLDKALLLSVFFKVVDINF